MKKLKGTNIYPPITNEQAYAVGRKLLGIATTKDLLLLGIKKVRVLKRRNRKKRKIKRRNKNG